MPRRLYLVISIVTIGQCLELLELDGHLPSNSSSSARNVSLAEVMRSRRGFGRSEYLLPENFRTLRRKDIPVTYRLHDDLLRYYRKGTRPVTHPSKVVKVAMMAFLYQIIKLDAVKNTISMSGSFELFWQDEFLQWEPERYEGATEIFLSSSDVWIPEFSLYYSHQYHERVKMQSNNDIRVNFTGHIRYYLPFATESLCKLDVKFFPFDIQKCQLLFGSWAHSNESIKFALFSTSLSLIDFYDNQEWELHSQQSTISANGFLYDYLDPPLFWEMIIIDLVVSRQSFYYVFNLVIPSTIITFVAVIGFHTPSTSGRVRDAKFRLGIMTLMSMSVILLAIVEDMPKFSMSSSRKGRGSFSGIPLIGLYYFILLAIIGLSTVTTSMFVFLERDVRVKHQIPWYLMWLSFDVAKDRLKRTFSCKRKADPKSPTTQRLIERRSENGALGNQPTPPTPQQPQWSDELKTTTYARSVALSLLRLIPSTRRKGGRKSRGEFSSGERGISSTDDPEEHYLLDRGRAVRSPPGSRRRQNRNRRLTGKDEDFDSMILYDYVNQTMEELSANIVKIEQSVNGIREEIVSLLPQDDLNSKWQVVIRRLELLSLFFYMSLIFMTMFLFFYHDWYCGIGHNPCGAANLKCPWMEVHPESPTCSAHSGPVFVPEMGEKEKSTFMVHDKKPSIVCVYNDQSFIWKTTGFCLSSIGLIGLLRLFEETYFQ